MIQLLFILLIRLDLSIRPSKGSCPHSHLTSGWYWSSVWRRNVLTLVVSSGKHFLSTEEFKIKRFVPKLTKINVKTKLHRPLLVIFDNSKSRTIPTPRGQTVGLIVQRVTCTIVDFTIICSKAVRHVSLETESEVVRSYFKVSMTSSTTRKRSTPKRAENTTEAKASTKSQAKESDYGKR